MPELPEVETVMNGLRPIWEGHIFQKISVNRPDLRRPFPPKLKHILEGSKILRLSRRAKYILCDIVSSDSESWTLILHLGMSGRLLIDTASPPSRKHEHLVFFTEEGVRVAFVDPRRFGLVDLLPSQAVQTHPLFAALGLEPLDPKTFTLQAFSNALLKTGQGQRAAKTSIKAALLDQKRLVGLGNIYVCEVLFRASISPLTPLNALSKKQITTLWRLIPDLLHQAINTGGSTLRDYVQTDGQAGSFQDLHQVYGREGQPCPDCPGSDCHNSEERCTGIRRLTQNGRSTFFCPRKQYENRGNP